MTIASEYSNLKRICAYVKSKLYCVFVCVAPYQVITPKILKLITTREQELQGQWDPISIRLNAMDWRFEDRGERSDE